MENSARTGLHDFNLASRKAEEAGCSIFLLLLFFNNLEFYVEVCLLGRSYCTRKVLNTSVLFSIWVFVSRFSAVKEKM